MKIAVISDTHFGFGWGTERQDDAFIQAQEAFEQALDCDLILLGGDIFDNRIPSQEVWKQALHVLELPLSQGQSTVILQETSFDRKLSPLIFSGIPVVAIHGTHERRAQGFVNPIELLEQMGYMIHLHGESVVFAKEVNGQTERVAIHGMSGVPERYASDLMQTIQPTPYEGCYNILLLHQSIEGYVYTEEDEGLSHEDLPDGFDLIIDGHIHWQQFGGTKQLVFPGSTITTQMNKIEADIPKGYMLIDTEQPDGKQVQFPRLFTSRPLYVCEEHISGSDDLIALVESVKEKTNADSHDRAPLVKLDVTADEAITAGDIYNALPDTIIASVSVNTTSKQKHAVRQFQRQSMNILEEGIHYLEKEMQTSVRDVFEQLMYGHIDAADRQLDTYIAERETDD